MPNLFDYLTYKTASFSKEPLNPVDAAVFSQACMIDGAGTVPAPPRMPGALSRAMALVAPNTGGARFSDLVRACGEAGERADRMFTGLVPRSIRDLLFALTAAPRFRDVRMRDAASTFSDKDKTQFGAVTFTTAGGMSFVAFRGTDASFTGWRENFNMAYRDVPAQELARDYLENVVPRLPGRVHVGGHSKGGNLALYAALTCSERVRSRIERVWCIDGPGFRSGRFSEEDYARLDDRVSRIVPQDSVIGMLLDCPIEPSTVWSNAYGVDQHSVFSWEVDGSDFRYLDRPNDSTLIVHDVTAEWLEGMDAERTEQAVAALFAAAEKSGAKDAAALLCGGQDKLRAVAQAARKIDPASRDVLNEVLGNLVGIAARRVGKDMAEALFGWIG